MCIGSLTELDWAHYLINDFQNRTQRFISQRQFHVAKKILQKNEADSESNTRPLPVIPSYMASGLVDKRTNYGTYVTSEGRLQLTAYVTPARRVSSSSIRCYILSLVSSRMSRTWAKPISGLAISFQSQHLVTHISRPTTVNAWLYTNGYDVIVSCGVSNYFDVLHKTPIKFIEKNKSKV